MITLEEFRTKINTHGLAAGAKTAEIGYLEDIALLRGQANKTDYYPVILITPPNMQLTTDLDNERYQDECIISCIYLFDRDSLNKNSSVATILTERVKAWDSAVALLKDFIDRLNTDANISALHDTEPYPVELFPEGQTLENSVAAQATINLEFWCDV